MSSYLRRLAKRSLGAQPSVKPRLPGRFETVDPFGVVPDEPAITEIAAGAGGAPERPLEPSDQPPARPSEPPAKPPSMKRPLDRVNIFPDTVKPASMQAQRQREEHSASSPPAPDSNKQMPIREIVGRIHHITSEPSGEPPEWIPPPDEPGREKREAGHLLVRPVSAAGMEDGAVLSRSPSTPPISPRSAATARTQTETGLRPALEPVPVGPPRQVPETAEPETSAPTIQVTIGRVEVRAAPPPEKAKRRREEQPVMSLDEYMRKRREGGGR